VSPIRAVFNGKNFLRTILLGWIGLGVVLAQDGTATPEAVDSSTATGISTETWAASPTFTPVWTDVPPSATSSQTPTATATPPDSVTPAVIPVTLSATPAPTPFIPTAVIMTQLVPVVLTSPPLVVTQLVANPPVPSLPIQVHATVERTPHPSDIFGWSRSESIALVQVSGSWYLRQSAQASRGAFHESLHNGAILRLPFEGDGIRIGFIGHHQGGAFRVLLDGAEIAVVDTFNPDETALTLQTMPHFTAAGYHVLDIVAMLPADRSRSIAIDYVDVFNGPPLPATEIPIAATAQPTRIVLENVVLVSAPILPTVSPTPVTESPLALDVIVGYDLNANTQIEPNEGVQGLSVRVVDARDNTLLASVFTDSAGFARIQTVVSGDVVILIPLLGETLHLRQGSRQSSWVLRLDAVNVPGLIP
jgi:hypothetical protein